ncbi:MAG TPA: glycine--tRNA ligase subunit beta [Anaerolineae bacterium]|nr:glycine--tRNA ligase subunit beta [Anaerolineae bacterium]HQK14277.1 glycine--tRNA ligase subunit beta [Anaerolineae bacterium]
MLTFQEVLLRLQRYWADQGALLWLPYSEKVGAGTMNPATFLRVLGPEPWNVVYIEPSYRPDDGRYAENPNRMQMHTQLQVILKPDPGDPQERYLKSLEAIGIRREEHDIRFVEDNWESPALGAWGLGWEVWLDGQEITQYTYFQQAGGINLEIPAVELTYGLERIVMYLQNVRSVWDIAWDEHHTYGEILKDQEIDHCRYEFEYADVARLQAMYDLFEQEALLNLKHGLVVPALDYILRCSHTFNLLDSRGTVGVTERAVFFKRMRDLARQVAEAYLAQRDRASFPWQNRPGLTSTPTSPGALMHLPLQDKVSPVAAPASVPGRAPFLFELGVEELPAGHLSTALAQWRELVPAALDAARLEHGDVHIWGTPRRLVVYVADMALKQADETLEVKGPPARAAFDADGKPTRAAEGFARSKGVTVADLQVRETESGAYIFATQHIPGRPAAEVLAELLPDWIAKLRFPRAMRWNATGVAFSRPIRWLLALLGEDEVSFTYAGLQSGRITRGPRPVGSPEVALAAATDYRPTLASYGVIVDPEARAAEILRQARAVAAEVGGQIPEDPALLEEVTNLVEVPVALLGSFEKRYLTLPQDVLIAVMKKHQRYFPVLDARGRIMAHFIAVRNGGKEHLDIVRQGNEDVIRARYADAEFFYNQDCRRPLAEYREGLAKLTFQADLGSMLQKSERLEKLALWVGEQLRLSAGDMATLARAAYLAKADLATHVVIEMTSLQGIMGREYARRSGEPLAVAQAIFEHYLPRAAGDQLPESMPGIALALADRLDSLAGLFAVGLAPTGSADPYGLRRAASGIVQILLERHLPFSTRAGLAEAARALPVEVTPESLNAALDFIIGRLQGMLREAGLPFDVVEAALAARGENPVLAREAAEQLRAWVARDDWNVLLDNYARCVRITRDQPRFALHPEWLREPAERALYTALCQAEAAISPTSDVNAFLTAFTPLVPFIQKFFDEVLVMDKDAALREARLALLQRIVGLADGIVDLSKLEGF